MKKTSCAALEAAFDLPPAALKKIIRDFHRDMRQGLAGKRSSLKMLPTYVSRPMGSEKGSYLALDLGGTNFRVLDLTLRGKGRMLPPRVMTFAIPKRHMVGTGSQLFDFIAGCIGTFIRRYGVTADERRGLGFTFSFPVRQTGLASGRLLCWTKDFSARGVVGHDVVAVLQKALARRGLEAIRVSALVNDTVGTLMTRSYRDPACDVGVIVGTGTNACYPERSRGKPGEMIINIEWGNFNKLPRTVYDRELDRASENRGEQTLEKMVSGMYLGEIARRVIAALARDGALFPAAGAAFFAKGAFPSAYLSAVEDDAAPRFARTARILRDRGITRSTTDERRLVRDVCRVVARRSARIVAAAILAVVTRMDPKLSRRHTVALDGSVYEKHPAFERHVRDAFREVVGARASRIRMVLAKDGSGKGAAITAAVAYAGTHLTRRR